MKDRSQGELYNARLADKMTLDELDEKIGRLQEYIESVDSAGLRWYAQGVLHVYMLVYQKKARQEVNTVGQGRK